MNKLLMIFTVVFFIASTSIIIGGETNNLDQQIDIGTADLEREVDQQDVILDTQEENILWDLTHGIYLNNYHPDYGHDVLSNHLDLNGHSIVTTDEGLDNIDLSGYDMIVVSWGTAYDSQYSTSEVEAIRAFVENGGGLLIMGDNTNIPNQNINPVSEEFGVTCGVSYIYPNDLTINDLEDHAVFDSVSQIFYRAAGEINIFEGPAEAIASYDGMTVVSAGLHESGRVVVLGDANCLGDGYIGNNDNIRFAVNLFNWLIQPTPQENILWDVTHGIYLDYVPEVRFTSLSATIAAHGHSFVTTDQGIENVDLSAYDVLIVSWITASESPYTTGEVAAIETFVENGGGLLITGDNTHCANDHINVVSQVFGVTCGVSYLDPYDVYINDLEDHEVFDGVSQIYYRAAGEISVDTDLSEPIAHYDGLAVASAGLFGYGKVVVLGDANGFENTYFGYSDNEQFAANLFNWLAEPTTSVDDYTFATPSQLSISQNYPNPFNANTLIEYNLDKQSMVKIDIYDVLGNRIETLVNSMQGAGVHKVNWYAGNYSSGVYFYNIQAGDHSETKKMTLVK